MLTFIITILQEIWMSLKLSGVLSIMAIIVCVMLLASPGAVATIIGGALKLGSWQHAKENRQKLQEG
jgi:uncharacterized membrane protein YkvI